MPYLNVNAKDESHKEWKDGGFILYTKGEVSMQHRYGLFPCLLKFTSIWMGGIEDAVSTESTF